MNLEFQSMSPIPLVFLLEELNFGGTQRQTLELARHLDKTLFRPEIWTVRAGEALLAMAKEAGIPVKILRNDATLRPFLAGFALCKHWRKERPVLIHLGTVFPNVWGRLLGKFFKTPVIIGGCKGQGNIRLQHERFLWSLAHAHICDAYSIKQGLEELGVPAQQVHCIPNGVNVEFFAPPQERVLEPEIVCVGRLVAEKDHATLLRAFAMVVAKVPKACLHIVGDGPLLASLQQLTQTLRIQHAVVFHGASSTVREHMHAARVLVLSSISEGTPNVLLEAMACALPIVATAVAGIPDMIAHEKQGLLVEARNPHMLANALVQVLEDDTLAYKLGKAGREHVCNNYSLDTVARKHEAVYVDLCKRVGL